MRRWRFFSVCSVNDSLWIKIIKLKLNTRFTRVCKGSLRWKRKKKASDLCTRIQREKRMSRVDMKGGKLGVLYIVTSDAKFVKLMRFRYDEKYFPILEVCLTDDYRAFKGFFFQMTEKRKRSFVLAYSQKQHRFPFLIFMPSIPALTNEQMNPLVLPYLSSVYWETTKQ